MTDTRTAVDQAAGKQLKPYQKAIKDAKDRFAKVAASAVDYDKESIFAMQALMKTDFAMNTANKNPQSVHLAMINVASTGLTLNPAHGYAYLVPRDHAIVLDISYKGLIKIATDTGAIRWARADLVYEADTFKYHGPARAPEHTAEVFRDRGDVVGAYCIAKTSDGDVLTEIMDKGEIEKIRGKSMAYDKKKSGPWVEWFEQMAKKAVIKRASKTWPYTERSDRLHDAIEIANESEGGYDLEGPSRKERCDEAAQDNAESVQAIKEGIAQCDLVKAAEAWFELDDDTKYALWLAPTKGGVFTTDERSAIKSSEFRKAYFGEAA